MDEDAEFLSAPYGQACANCARSKCKCVLRHSTGPCERCRRQNKHCHPAETVRRRNPRKVVASKAYSSSRLEEKVDDLVSLLKAERGSNALRLASQTTSDSHVRVEINELTSQRSGSGSSLHGSDTDIPGASNFKATPSQTPLIFNGRTISLSEDTGEPTRNEAETCLVNFRLNQSKYFPFIHVPDISAYRLRQQRPILWLAVMAASSTSASLQKILGDRIRQTIANEMVIHSEKNVDLLLGLLVFIGWSHLQVHSKPFLATFTQLALSLIFDLGLNRPPEEVSVDFALCRKPSAPRTMEERRAVLGCFQITSIMSLVLRRVDALRWTPHMNECLRVLEQAKDCPNDEILVQQVKLQLIVQNLHDEGLHDVATTDHASIYRETFHRQFSSLKADLLNRNLRNEVILLHLYSAELEIALLPTLRRSNNLTIQQQRNLKAGLRAVKLWFDVFLEIEPAAYIGFAFPVFLQIGRCLTTLFRLANPRDSIWSPEVEFNPTEATLISDRIASNFEQVAMLNGLRRSNENGLEEEAAAEEEEEDIYTRAAHMVRSFQTEWGAKLCAAAVVNLSAPNTPFHVPPHNIDNISIQQTLVSNLYDEDWFSDLVLFPND